jgi:IS30 family transposase
VRTRRLALYERVVALHAKGCSGVAIAREVGLVRQTVMRWLHRGGYPERRVGPPRARPIARYAEYLAKRWAEGCHNARRLERPGCSPRPTRGSPPRTSRGVHTRWPPCRS